MRNKTILLLMVSAAAYTQSASPEFDAASIKPATPLGPRGMIADQKGGPKTTDPGTFTCQNCTLYWVMADAYDIHGYDFSGPDWLQSARFDFAAKLPRGTTDRQFQSMLQNLLAERFKLAVHREKRSGMVYELSVGKNGPKFKSGTPPHLPDSDDAPMKLKKDADGFPILEAGRTSMALANNHGRMQLAGEGLEWFVQQLSVQLQSPVTDATGLSGKYDLVVSWTWDEDSGASGAATALINAVQQQLGLRMERKKGDIDVLVVDHMEKTPTAN